MAFFDEAYYIKSKLAQLAADGAVDADGNPFTEDSLRAAIAANGWTVEEHYNLFHTEEHTSANPYFNTTEYLEAKVKQLHSVGETQWTVEALQEAIESLGMTAEEHYEQFGCHETDTNGKLINPSNAFDANAYVEVKLAQLQQEDPENWAGKNAMDVLDAIVENGMTPVSHYEDFGKQESADSGVAMVQTVPVVERVANDQLRDVMEPAENVPSNYNKPVDAPANVTAEEATAVDKPCDMAAEDTVKPSDPVATPADVNYVPVPGNGIEDTAEKPVELVTATT